MSAPERRQTPSEREHELAMAFATRPMAAAEHSVEVSRNAKGQHQYTVTIRGIDADEVLMEALRISEILEERFPFGNGAPA